MTTPPLRRSVAIQTADMPFAPAPVEELMRLLVKAVRAQQLYLPNNPMHRTAIDALRAGFAAVWNETDELPLAVAETALTWVGAPVLLEATKSSDNLAWLFFKDGIREITFLKGVEETEIVRLLEIVARARKATVDDDDLVTMLWEADLSLLKYRYVDLLTEGGGAGEEIPTAGIGAGGAAETNPEEVRAATERAVSESQASGVVNMADFDSTLHFLDDKEVDYLKQEIAREYAQDLRMNVVAALLDVFEQQPIEAVREEILDDLETMLAYMLASGSFRGVAYLLTETTATAARADLSPELRARLSQLGDRLSASEALEQLLESLDDAPSLPATGELTALFDQLRPTALGTVFAWLPRVRSEELRALINVAAGRLAAANVSDLVKLVQSPDEAVSNEAIRRCGALKAQAAVLALGKIVGESNVKRRSLATQALADIGSPGALQAIERCIVDADRDLRILAARALGARAHRPLLARLEPIIRGKEIREADVTEKTAFFECYAALSGDAGVTQLDTILNGKGFLGRREDADMRAAAAMALGRVGTSPARDALQRSANEKDAVVRNAVARALRGGPA